MSGYRATHYPASTYTTGCGRQIVTYDAHGRAKHYLVVDSDWRKVDCKRCQKARALR